MDTHTQAFDLAHVLQADAAEIFAAREKARLLHRTKDIDAAGDEVEMAVRRVLARRLPSEYMVGHGHVVDEAWTHSPQLDLIIAGHHSTPTLLQSENGTAYLPYEAVYAFGEVKTTYRAGQIEAFMRTLATMRTQLHRAQTSSMAAPPEYRLTASGAPTPVFRPYLNPLFSFLLCADAGDFSVGDVSDLYRATPTAELPNVVCLLDAGVLVNANVFGAHEPDRPLRVNVIPEFAREGAECQNEWVYLVPEDSDSLPTYAFGMLLFTLMDHMQSCLLTPPNHLNYLRRAFSRQKATILWKE